MGSSQGRTDGRGAPLWSPLAGGGETKKFGSRLDAVVGAARTATMGASSLGFLPTGPARNVCRIFEKVAAAHNSLFPEQVGALVALGVY
jgi:hypothetical protein